MKTNKTFLYIFGGILLLCLVLGLGGVGSVQASHNLQEPTPTPTPTYWIGPAAGWHYDSANGSDIDDKITVPDDNEGRGYIIYIADTDWYQPQGGDQPINWSSPGNTIYNLKGLDGTTICLDDDGGDACEAVGFTGGGWADGFSGTPDYYISKGTNSTASATFTVRPIYYGIDQSEECEEPDPLDLPDVGSGTLAGDDEDGETEFDLEPGKDYYLVTSDGPWNDGSSDRYDIAISWDGETWKSLGVAAAEDDNASIACNAPYTGEDYIAVKLVPAEGVTDLYLRVNDLDGEFTDNTGGINYTLSVDPDSGGVGASCPGWSATDHIATGILYGADTVAVPLIPDGSALVPGETYSVTSMYPFSDDGSDNYDMRVYDGPVGVPPRVPDTFTNSNGRIFECVETAGDGYRGFFIAAKSGDDYYTMVNDAQANYLNNSGMLSYQVHGATYEPVIPACEANFAQGQMLNRKSLDSTLVEGMPIPFDPVLEITLVDGEWYMLDIPFVELEFNVANVWWDAVSSPNANVEIRRGGSWYPPDMFGACYVRTSLEGHMRVYFQADAADDTYAIRVDDNNGNYADNTGLLDVKLYKAEHDDDVPESCADAFPAYQYLDSYIVLANEQAGITLDPDSLFHRSYAPQPSQHVWLMLETSGGPWTDNANSTNSYGLEIQTGAGEWQTLDDTWPGAYCVDVDGYYYQIYFKHYIGGRTYQVRAKNLAGTWADNTGNMALVLNLASEYIPDNQCEQAYSQTEFFQLDSGNIDAQDSSGEVLRGVEGGEDVIYRLEVAGGPWQEGNGADMFGTQLSDDEGSTWVNLANYADADCVVTHPDGTVTIYYTTPVSSTFSMRAADNNSNWGDNSGSIGFILSSTSLGGPPGPPPPPPIIPGGEACTALCLSPLANVISFTFMGKLVDINYPNVAAWIEYARCRITQYLAWCPRHSAALGSLGDTFRERQPFATLSALGDALSNILAQIEERWGDPEEERQMSPDAMVNAYDAEGIFPTLPDDSIFNGGEIELMPEQTGDEYNLMCETELDAVLGSVLTGPMCFTFTILDNLGVLGWFQVIVDISTSLFLFLTIKSQWIKGK